MSKGNAYLNHTTAQLDEAIRKVLSGELDVPLQSKTATPSTSQQVITPDSNYKGLSQVTVEAIPQDYTDEVYGQGYNEGYDNGLQDATPVLQTKTITPTTSKQTVSPDNGYDGLSEVTVNAIPQSYTDDIYGQGYDDGYDTGYDAGYDAAKPYQTEVTYLQSSGTQYADTNFYPSGNSFRVVMKFRYTVSHSGLSLFGNHTSSPFSITPYGAQPVFYVGNSSAVSCGPTTALNTDYTLDVTASGGSLTAIWNGTKYTASYSGSLYTSDSIFVFGANSNGTLAESSPGYRLYYFQIYDNGVLMRDYIPVLDLDGVPCLYDKVKRKMTYNAGTGVFTYA